MCTIFASVMWFGSLELIASAWAAVTAALRKFEPDLVLRIAIRARQTKLAQELS